MVQGAGEASDSAKPISLEKPPLNCLVFGPASDKDQLETLKMPAGLVNKWWGREEFQNLHADLEKEFGDLTLRKDSVSPGKRKVEDEHESEPVRKMPKLELPFVDLSGMSGESLASVNLGGLKAESLELEFRTGNSVYVVNRSAKDVMIPEGYKLVHFPTRHAKFDKEASDRLSVLFEIRSPEAPIQLGPDSTTLYEALEHKKKEDPKAARLAFHTISEDPKPGKPGYFNIKPARMIYFIIPELLSQAKKEAPGEGEATTKLSQLTAGAAIPLGDWFKSPSLELQWLMRWKGQVGLVPMAPRVVTKGAFLVAAGKAVKIL